MWYILFVTVVGCIFGDNSARRYETLLDLMTHHRNAAVFGDSDSSQQLAVGFAKSGDRVFRSVQKHTNTGNHLNLKQRHLNSQKRKKNRATKLDNEMKGQGWNLAGNQISRCSRCSGQLSPWVPIVHGRRLQSQRFDSVVINRKKTSSRSPPMTSNFTVKTGAVGDEEKITWGKYLNNVKNRYGASKSITTSSLLQRFWHSLISPFQKLKDWKNSWLFKLFNGRDNTVSSTISYKAPNRKPYISAVKTNYGSSHSKKRPPNRPPLKKPNKSYGVPKIKNTPASNIPKNKPRPSYGLPNKRPETTYGAPKKKPSSQYGPPTDKTKESLTNIENDQNVELLQSFSLANQLPNSDFSSGDCGGFKQFPKQLQPLNSVHSQSKQGIFSAIEQPEANFPAAHNASTFKTLALYFSELLNRPSALTDYTLYPPLSPASSTNGLELKRHSYGPLSNSLINRNDHLISLRELSQLLQRSNELQTHPEGERSRSRWKLARLKFPSAETRSSQ